MGNKSTSTKINKKSSPDDIQFRKVIAKNDQYFLKIETQCNFFQYYTIEELIYVFLNYYSKDSNEEINSALADFNNKNSISNNKNTVNIMSDACFDKFIEIKILKNVLLGDDYVNSKQSNKDMTYFKAFYALYFKYFYKMYKNFHKYFFDEKLHSHDEFVPKLSLLALIFYYGSAQMRAKIDIFFSLFANEKDMVSLRDYNLQLALFSLIASGSGVSLLALNDLGKEDEEVRKEFPEDEFIRIYDVYQVRDILRILENVLKKLFDVSDVKENKEINSETFKWNFTKQGFYWLFYPSGVRNYLEANPE